MHRCDYLVGSYQEKNEVLRTGESDVAPAGISRPNGPACQHPIDPARGARLETTKGPADTNRACTPDSPVKAGPLRRSLSLWPTDANNTSAPGIPSQRSTSGADRSHHISSHQRPSNGSGGPHDAADCKRDHAPYAQFQALHSQPGPASERSASIGVQCKLSLELTAVENSDSAQQNTQATSAPVGLDNSGNESDKHAGPGFSSTAVQVSDEAELATRSVSQVAVLRSAKGEGHRNAISEHARALSDAHTMPGRLALDTDSVSIDDLELRAAIQHVNNLLHLRRNQSTSRRRNASTSTIHKAKDCDQSASTRNCGEEVNFMGPWADDPEPRMSLAVKKNPTKSDRAAVGSDVVGCKLRSSSEGAQRHGRLAKGGETDGFWGKLASFVACGSNE